MRRFVRRFRIGMEYAIRYYIPHAIDFSIAAIILCGFIEFFEIKRPLLLSFDVFNVLSEVLLIIIAGILYSCIVIDIEDEPDCLEDFLRISIHFAGMIVVFLIIYLMYC